MILLLTVPFIVYFQCDGWNMVSIRTLRRDRHLKVFLIAGESSGDAYGAELIRAEANLSCQRMDPPAVGWGGDDD